MQRQVVLRAVATRWIVCAVIFGALAPGLAWGEASSSVREQAREHARQARVQYDLGRFREALTEYEAAYELLPAPGVLFNIGQCHRLLGNYERAIFFFEGYLRQLPEAPNRADVEELITVARAELERQAAESAASPPDPATEHADEQPPTTDEEPTDVEQARVEPERRPVHRTWWFWTILGTVVVGAGLGVGLGLGLDAGEPTQVLPTGSMGVLDGRQ